MNKKAIIITSINSENEALKKFSEIKDYDLILVGDKKSPLSYNLGLKYLDINKQLEIFPKFSEMIPYNHYARKNIGYLFAFKNGYEMIAESDDDNIPMEDWGEAPFVTKLNTITNPKFPNVYKEFTGEHVWPRGFPLSLITDKEKNELKELENNILVWQGLANGSPDVDALYRLVINKDIEFKTNKYIALDKGVLSAFNSQNTFWTKQAFCFMYLPHTVTFRYTDILRSFVAQYGLWARGGRLGFMSPNVVQERNPHNLMKDFIDEYPMYVSFEQVVDILERCELNGSNEDLMKMYEKLYEKGIVKEEELYSVSEWLKNINGISNV